MALEIEKKYLISEKTAKNLKENHLYQMIGIIQWYIDGAKEIQKSERIRLIIDKEGHQSWIKGKKECINGDLVHRNEEETQLNQNSIEFEKLKDFPFIIKTRSLFNSPFQVEVALDKLLDNPFLSYDVINILEVELKNNQNDVDTVVDKVLEYFGLTNVKDISKNFDYTNNAIAFRSRKKNNFEQIKLTNLISILKNELRSDEIEH